MIFVFLRHSIKSQDGSGQWLALFLFDSVELKNNSRKVFRNWHAQIFEKCCTRFYLDWRGRRRVERRKLFLPDVYWIECFHWIFPLLAKFFRSQFWIIILYPRLLRLYIQSSDIIKDIKSRSHLAFNNSHINLLNSKVAPMVWSAIWNFFTLFTKCKTHLFYVIILSCFIIILSYKEIRLSFKENKTFCLILILSFKNIKLPV